ncbi:MAG: N-acetylglucosamine-6-phosphate deacetylase [Lachnospiraceae bacterium]
MIIKNGSVFTEKCCFEKGAVITEESVIAGFIPGDRFPISSGRFNDTVIDASGCYVIPGLIDIHFHGCVGHDFCDGTAEAFEAIAAYQLQHGITSICPATMTLPKETLLSICREAVRFADHQERSIKETASMASLIGIHLEGPYLSLEKKGAQNPEYLRLPYVNEIKELAIAADGLLKILSIAPELPGSMEAIEELKNLVVLSVAHTTADYETALRAFKGGASHVTHLYNAMPPYSHRAPGVIGAAADMDCDVELISDGIHVHPSVIRSTFKMFDPRHVILISDSMMAAGMPPGDYSLGGQAVKVEEGRLATLSDGTIAGSATNLFDCMLYAISCGIPMNQAIAAATLNPARSIGMDRRLGSIEEEKTADLLVLNRDFTIRHIIHHGVLVK